MTAMPKGGDLMATVTLPMIPTPTQAMDDWRDDLVDRAAYEEYRRWVGARYDDLCDRDKERWRRIVRSVMTVAVRDLVGTVAVGSR